MEQSARESGRKAPQSNPFSANVPPEQQHDAVVILEGPDARVRYANQAAISILGAGHEAVPGRPMAELHKGVQFFAEGSTTPLPQEEWPYVRVMRGEHLDGLPVTRIDRYGNTRQLLVSGIPLSEVPGMGAGALMTTRDVTHLGRAESPIERVFEKAGLGTMELDLEARITKVNSVCAAMLGRADADLVGRPFSDLVHPEDRHIADELTEGLRSGSAEAMSAVVRLSHPSGRLLHIRKVETITRRPDGQPLSFLCLLEDVTSAVMAEVRLRQSEADLAEAQRLARLGNWTLNLKTNRGVWSEELARLYELPTDVREGRFDTFAQAVHPDDRDRLEAEINRAIAEIGPFSTDFRVRLPSGRLHIHHTEGRVVAREGQPVEVFGITKDVTENRELEERFKLEQEHLHDVQRLGRLIYFDWDIPHDRFFPSPEAIAMLGLDEAWTGASIERFFTLIHPEDLARARAAVETALATATPYEVEFRARHADGHYLTLLLRGHLQLDAQDRPLRLSGAAVDITERRRAEEMLRRREADLAEAEQLALLGNWTIDLRTGKGHWSEGLSAIYGLTNEQGDYNFEDLWAMIHPDDRKAVRSQFSASVADGRPFNYDHRIIRRDGEIRSIHTRGRILTDDSGAAIAVFGTSQDVTERKQLEEALKEQRSRLQEAQRISGLGFWDWDPVADRTQMSDGLLEMMDLDASWQGAPMAQILDLVHPADKAWATGVIQAALAEGHGYEVEVRVVTPKGKELVLLARSELTLDAGGRPVRLVGTALDITSSKRAEEQVRRSEAMLAEAQRLARLGNWTWDLKSGIIDRSPEVSRMFGNGKVPAQATLEQFLSIVHVEDRAAVETAFRRVVQTREPFEIEHRIVLPSGAIRYVQERGRLISDADGHPLSVFGTTQDITESRQAEHLKGEILSIVSHELRTPLTTIGAPLEMLKEQVPEQPETRLLFDIVVRSVQRMRRLVEDILDMERLVHGRLEMHLASTRIAQLVTQVSEEMKALAVSHGVRLETAKLEGVALCDPLRVSQVLTNLLNNAIAYSPSGAAVTLSAEVIGNEVRVGVQDRGRGVPPELQTAIFEPFRQGEPSATRRKGGTGLGLAVARAIIEQLQGRIWVESEPGHGSTFYFTLPLAKQEAGEA